jgi:hypothetical protein
VLPYVENKGVENPTLSRILWKLKYFTKTKYNLQKTLLKETKILQDIIITL